MRVFVAVVLAAASLSVAACSGGTEDSTLRRSPSSPARSQEPSTGTAVDDATSSATPAPSSSSSPSPSGGAPGAPDGGAGTPVPTPPAPGSCLDPKCVALGGVGACKATDTAGSLVTMACKNGFCACLTGTQTTVTFEGEPNDETEARQLFLANCGCN